MRRSILATLGLAVLAAAPVRAEATLAGAEAGAAATSRAEVPVTLKGSLTAMRRQHGVALELGFPFVRTPAELARMENDGEVVRLHGNDDYGFREGVRSMVARPEMRTFIERLAADYRGACGEKLVVTSLTRPTTRQPRNAHRLSVHPTGIAVDLRVSRHVACRSFLEEALLVMEEAELLDVTRERYPPHYHVALFPDSYMAHLAPVLAAERAREAREREARLVAGVAMGGSGEGTDWGMPLLWAVVLAGVGLSGALSGARYYLLLTGRGARKPDRS